MAVKLGCHFTVRSSLLIDVKVGRENGSYFDVSFVADTGSGITWMLTNKSKFWVRRLDGIVLPSSWEEYHLGQHVSYPDLPSYTPAFSDKMYNDKECYADGLEVHFSVYKNQRIFLNGSKQEPLCMSIGFVTHFILPINVHPPESDVGLLGLALRTIDGKHNMFMKEFIKQRPELKPVVSFDLNFNNGIHGKAVIGIGRSLKPDLMSRNAPVIDASAELKWIMKASYMKIKYPGKEPWIHHNVSGYLDTGSSQLVIPRKFLQQMEKEGKVDKEVVDRLRMSRSITDSNLINDLLPVYVELEFKDKTGNAALITLERDSLYVKLFNHLQHREKCCLSFLVSSREYCTFGIPVFTKSYVELNFEMGSVLISPN